MLQTIRTPKTLFPVVWQGLGAGIQLLGLSYYLGLKTDWILFSTTTVFVFSIYLFNRLTDSEDAYTRPEQRLYYQRNKLAILLAMSLALFGCVGLLVFSGNLLTWHFVLLAIGVLYSVHLIPVYRGGRLIWLRLKDIIGAKNVIVSVLWALNAVALLLGKGVPVHRPLFHIWIITVAFFFSIMANTISCDVRDIEGDRRLNVPTLATTLGRRRVLFLVLGMIGAACTAVAIFYIEQMLPLPLALYSWSVMLWAVVFSLHNYLPEYEMPREAAEILVDTLGVFSGIALMIVGKLM